MAELDLLALEEHLKTNKEHFKRFIKSQKGISALLEEIIGIINLVGGQNNFNFGIGMFLSTYSIYSIKDAWKSSEDIISSTNKYLKETKTFKSCASDYKEFISELAIFIKCFGFESIKEIIYFLDFMLSEGMLSPYPGFNTHRDFRYSKDCYITELCGAFVLTGKNLCRHRISFMADELNELGCNTCAMAVYETTSPLSSLSNSFNHAILGIAENNTKYCYDQGAGCFYGTVKHELRLEKDRKNLVSKVIIDDSDKQKYYVLKQVQNLLNDQRLKEAFQISSLPNAEINPEEVKKCLTNVKNVFSKDFAEISKFYFKHYSLIKSISDKLSILLPRSDEPIKTWRIK